MMEHPKKLIGLDILRGLACLTVWVSHIRVATDYFNAPKYDPIQVFVAWGREAVIVFFILSGIVINMASQNRADRGLYFKKRFLRIYPVFFAVMVICYCSQYFVFGHQPTPGDIAGNVFLLGMWPRFFVSTLPYDTASWSIACEAFFYIVFGLFYTGNRRRAVWIWFVLSVLSIAFRLTHAYHVGVFYQFALMMNHSFLWLLGYLLFEYRDRLAAHAPAAACGLLMVPMITRLNSLSAGVMQSCYYVEGLYLVPLFIFVLNRNKRTQGPKPLTIRHVYLLAAYLLNVWLLWSYSNSLMISKIIYSVIPAFSLLLYSRFIKSSLEYVYDKVKRLVLFFAEISYPLYLLHMPTMYLVYHFMPRQKLAGMLLIVAIAITVSYLFEVYLFRKLSAYVNRGPVRQIAIEETII